MGIENIYTEKGIKYVHHLETAVKAEAVFEKDKDYVVKLDRWLGVLIKYYHVADEKGLKRRITKEIMYKDSLETMSYCRFYKLKTKAALDKKFEEIAKYDSLESRRDSFSLNKMTDYRFTKYPRPLKQFDPNAAQQAKAVVNAVITDVTQMGWVNMDKFMGMKNLIALKPANPEKAQIVAVFTKLHCCLGISDDLNAYSSTKGAPQVPSGEAIVLIAYKMKDGKFYLGMSNTTTTEATTLPAMQALSPLQLSGVLADL